MTPSFAPHLINDPFGDPGLYVEVRWSRRALLFDLGDNHALSPTRLLRAADVFVSHTHMDHFIGFDRLIRVALGRGKHIRLHGPPGLIENVSGKLRGYTWNLVDGYPLSLEVREYHPDHLRSVVYHAKEGFFPREQEPVSADHGGLFPMVTESQLSVQAVSLDHRIPSFGFVLEEPFHININKERLHEAGLPVGSWLKDVKQHLWAGRPDSFRFPATLYHEHRQEIREFCLGDIRERFTTVSRGQKIAYVVDCRYDDDNEAKIVQLAQQADTLFCEAPFLDRDVDKARSRYHLTAKQAGLLARKAQVRELVVFHFSPRYTGMEEAVRHEARAAFLGADSGRKADREAAAS